MVRKMLGWGGGDVNVPDTCTHVGCYARCWVGVGGMLTFLTLAHMLDGTQDATPVDNNFQREGQRESSLEVSLAWTVASSERRPCVRQPRQVMQTKPTRKIEKKKKKKAWSELHMQIH